MYEGLLYIASDHGGYQLKRRLVRYVQNELKRDIVDMGPTEYTETDDYPDYVLPLAKKVAEEDVRGIVICRNGVGVCIASNKVAGIRAGIGYNIPAAESMMKDDNTNILCLAADHLSEDHAMHVVERWLQSEFSKEERHVRRLQKIEDNI
ncbi:RpiB/LacA/LacB family sugar-phosphate isomerase [Patescibacteria group bacterium]|nr:RpiB/LacA/LacB family sugar-phosphate isomerase [Patescibacteria group bacterium]MBU1721313.1 RpiB/LacA/LacB family sugar-phosphate isomerase [Patescibacteria group bacterium]MBU1901743.1 RpiB/LacA/LacB family sugar-phosphate isomerase [Patescibacteria group bacterium]